MDEELVVGQSVYTWLPPYHDLGSLRKRDRRRFLPERHHAVTGGSSPTPLLSVLIDRPCLGELYDGLSGIRAGAGAV